DGFSHVLTASYQFNHTETPNDEVCPVGSVTKCDDIVSFSLIDDSFSTIEYDGATYSFVLENFVTADGKPVSNFLTKENYANSALLVGSFTVERPDIPETPPAVPVPA